MGTVRDDGGISIKVEKQNATLNEIYNLCTCIFNLSRPGRVTSWFECVCGLVVCNNKMYYNNDDHFLIQFVY